MPEISIPVTGNEIAAPWQFAQAVEWLEVADKTITKISYPHGFAVVLGIAEHQGAARYRGHPCEGNHDAPYKIVIEYD